METGELFFGDKWCKDKIPYMFFLFIYFLSFFGIT